MGSFVQWAREHDAVIARADVVILSLPEDGAIVVAVRCCHLDEVLAALPGAPTAEVWRDAGIGWASSKFVHADGPEVYESEVDDRTLEILRSILAIGLCVYVGRKRNAATG
jgi:hypothetical protein